MNKNHKHILSFLWLFIFLYWIHYSIYSWNISTDFYIQTYSNTPVDIPGIKFEREIRPTYLAPLQRLTYIYYDEYNPENIIIQKEQWFFHSDLEIIQGKNIVDKYFNSSWHMFLTGFAVNEYPSVLYFFIFYLWIWLLIYNFIQILIINKKN